MHAHLQLTVLMAPYGWWLEKTMNTTWQKQIMIKHITLMTNLAVAGWRSVKEENTIPFVLIFGTKAMLLWSVGS